MIRFAAVDCIYAYGAIGWYLLCWCCLVFVDAGLHSVLPFTFSGMRVIYWSWYLGGQAFHGCCQGSAFFVGPVMVSLNCFSVYTICDIGLLVFRLLNAQHIHTGNDDNYRCLQNLWLWFSNTCILAGQPYPICGCSHGWCSILLLYLQTLVISPWLIWRRHYPGRAALPRWWLQPWLAFAFLSQCVMIIRFWYRCERMYVCVTGIQRSVG